MIEIRRSRSNHAPIYCDHLSFERFAVTVFIYALNISCEDAADSAGRWRILPRRDTI